MTGLTTSVGAALLAGVLALGGSLGSGQDVASVGQSATSAGTGAGGSAAPTALVIDASHAGHGRELVDQGLRELDAEVRLPRSFEEARTNVRYFDALGYRVVVAGPEASAAAGTVGVDAVQARGLRDALQAAVR